MFNFLVVLLLQARWAVPAGGAVALEGPWRFRAGDSLAWMSPAYNDGRWTLSTLAAPWSYRSAPRTRGFVWFRGWLTLAAVPDAQLGAILRTDGMAFEIYVDGVRIGGVGGFPPDYRARTVLPVPFAIPLASLAPGPHLVAIRTYSTESRVVPPAPLVVAPLADLLGRVRREDLYMFGAAVLFLGLAAYQLFFWARRREAREHLYVFLFCGTLALLFLNWMPSVRLALSPTVDWFRLYLAFGATAAAMLALGARGIFDIEPDSLAARGTAALGVVYGLLVPLAFLLPEWSALRWMEQYVFNVGVAAGAVVLVVLSAAARRRDLPYGTTLLAGSFALAMAAAHDVALSWGWIPGEWGGATIVTQYGAVAFVLSVALATAGRFADTQTTALYDRLTGLYRREVVMDALAREIRRAARIHQPLTVLMLDIDHFKVVNDSLGHQGGDRVLGEVGRRLADAGRVVDWVGRYGGEEFLAVLAGTGGAGAHLAAERFRTAVSALPIGAGRAARTVTLSAGIAAYDGGEEWPTSEQLVGAADAALYRAKNAGRNCTSD